jgi:hypothetical protein
MTSRTNTKDDHPRLVQIQRTTSAILSSFSYDGTDLISKEDGTCVTELSSRPPSATSFLDENLAGEKLSSKQQLPFRRLSQETSTSSFKSIYVTVSGTSFSVPREAFVKLGKLKWMRDRKGVAHLDISPAIFEVLLGYVVFETLPAYDTLSKSEYDEFEPMAQSLGFFELIQHFDRSSDKSLRSTRGARRSFLKKRQPSTNRGGGAHMVLNSESTNVVSAKLMAANSSCSRFVASLLPKSTGKHRDRRSKITHDQLCSLSDHVS